MATPVATERGAAGPWRVTTEHPDGSQTIVLVTTYARALARLEAATPGELVTIRKVGQTADALMPMGMKPKETA